MRGALLEEAFGMHEWVQELYGFNVHYVEQLGAIMLTFEGRMALSRLEHALSESYINQLQSRVDKFMVQYHKLSLSAPRNVSPVSGMSILPQRSYGLGYKLPPHLQVLRFGGILPPHAALSMVPPLPPSAAPLPPECDLRPILTPVRNQFVRGTCVAFATTALLESKIFRDTGQSVDLSEQYIYFVARQNDPDRSKDETYLNYALDGLQQRGTCREELLSYIPFNDWGQALLFQNPINSLSQLDADAQNYRIDGYTGLNPEAVDAVKQALLNKQPVCIGVQVFRQAWYENGFAESTGEIQMPLTRINPLDGSEMVLDTIVSGHAIAIVGYKDTPDPNDPRTYRPGGGYFVFKNSWGTEWAANNADYGPGLGLLPYAYLQKYNMDAYVIT